MTTLLDQAYYLCKQGTEAHKADSLEQLTREYPAITSAQIEDAFNRAASLIEMSCEWAEQKRSPNNDGTGVPAVDIEGRCPGFSRGIYSDAEAWGLYLTK